VRNSHMSDELPSLYALRCFEVTARSGSMSQAARELGLTHGAVSRQVGIVEEALGVALFLRVPRGLSLTREGLALAAAVARALSEIRAGVTEVERLSAGPIALSCEPSLTLAWLIPRLARLERSTELRVQVRQGGGAVDFAREGVDFALRRADFDHRGISAAPVMDEWLGPVCAPALAKRARRALEKVPLLRTRTRPHAWATWAAAVERPKLVARGPAFDHFATAVQAAIAGLGATISPYQLVEAELVSGRLVAPFGFVKGDVGYVLLARRPFEEDPRGARLLAWLQQEGRKGRPAKKRSKPRSTKGRQSS
jgi:LysR family glycine cleavage system transcriptional activator